MLDRNRRLFERGARRRRHAVSDRRARGHPQRLGAPVRTGVAGVREVEAAVRSRQHPGARLGDFPGTTPVSPTPRGLPDRLPIPFEVPQEPGPLVSLGAPAVQMPQPRQVIGTEWRQTTTRPARRSPPRLPSIRDPAAVPGRAAGASEGRGAPRATSAHGIHHLERVPRSRACVSANRQKTGHQMTSLNTQIQPKLQGSAPVDAL